MLTDFGFLDDFAILSMPIGIGPTIRPEAIFFGLRNVIYKCLS
jgi:hypothetical protein